MGYLENHLSSSMIVEVLEWDLIRINQDIAQNISILPFPIPLCEEACSAVNSVSQKCQVSEDSLEEEDKDPGPPSQQDTCWPSSTTMLHARLESF